MKANKLRELFKSHGVIRVMGAHDGLSAKLAERAGFDAIWASGLEISAAHAVPDANILTMTEFLAAANNINQSTNIPVVCDCDTGFGNANNVAYLVKQYESCGIAAVCIEDKLFPKLNSFVAGNQTLLSQDEFCDKIRAAKYSQRDPDFMLIARTESFISGHGLEEALIRAKAYEEAGADAILVHSKQASSNEVDNFMRAYSGKCPIVIVPTTYPEMTFLRAQQLGIKMVICANQGIRGSINAMEQVYSAIIQSGGLETIERKIASMNVVFELQGMYDMKDKEATFKQ